MLLLESRNCSKITHENLEEKLNARNKLREYKSKNMMFATKYPKPIYSQ